MSETMKPQLFVSARPYGKETFPAGQLYISCIPYGTQRIVPVLFASCIVPERVETVTADTERDLFYGALAASETRRDVYRRNVIAADTARSLIRIPPVTADVRRDVAVTEQIVTDSVRRLAQQELVTADTQRKVASPIQKVFADTWRGVAAIVSLQAETCRSLAKIEQRQADTARQLPYILKEYVKSGIQSVSISLNERTLSDAFQLVTSRPLEIEDAICGKVLDYPYSFLVEETSQKDLLQTVKGMYSVDKLLYTAINISVTSAMASYYLRQIALALGMEIHYAFEDFQPSQNYENSGMTYQDLISSLFGWTSRLPQRQINVFIRGKKLYAVQRGRESSVLDITDWPHTRPSVSRKLVRSVWNSATNDNLNHKAHNDKTLEPTPFTGTISAAGCSLEYREGLLMREDQNGDVTTYAYEGEYLKEKRIHNKDGSTVQTQYEYAWTANDIYLFAERERSTESPKDGKTHDVYDWKDWDGKGTERVTYHSPVGYGWYTTTVYVDNEFQGSSLSQGKPGGKASKFTIDESNLSLGGKYKLDEDDTGESIPGTSLIDTEFPVEGDVFLYELTKAINWLNRKRQEEVTLEIVSRVKNGVSEIQHIVDFTERIRFDGKEYFLVSNQIELTPRSLRQKLKLVRWYE